MKTFIGSALALSPGWILIGNCATWARTLASRGRRKPSRRIRDQGIQVALESGRARFLDCVIWS